MSDLMESDRRSKSLFWRTFDPMTGSYLSVRALAEASVAFHVRDPETDRLVRDATDIGPDP
jgi:hypothetical protein